MKKIGLFTLSLVVVSMLSAVDAAALTKGAGPGGQQLSGGECTGLGGSVVVDKACNSGQACQTVDQNGVVHEVCLTTKVESRSGTRHINPGKLTPNAPAVKGQ